MPRCGVPNSQENYRNRGRAKPLERNQIDGTRFPSDSYSLPLPLLLPLPLPLSRWSLEPDTTCCSSLFPLPLPLCLSLWSLEPKTKCFGWNVTSRLSLSSLRSLEPETKCFGSNVGSVPLPLLARALTSLQTPPSPSSPSHPLLTLLSLLFELEEQLAPTTSGSDMIRDSVSHFRHFLF